MIALFWKPKGRYVHPIDLKDGQYVEGYFWPNREGMKRKFTDGRIVIKHDTYRVRSSDGLYEHCKSQIADIYLLMPSETEYKLGYLSKGEWHPSFGCKFRFFTGEINKLRSINMANKLLALVRLNKNQRKLTKAGIYDENGNLTDDGKEVLLNLIAKDYEDKLIELVKDWKDDKKGKDEE